MQCVSETGTGACSDQSVEPGLTTPCVLEADFGTCDGNQTNGGGCPSTCQNEGGPFPTPFCTRCRGSLPRPNSGRGIDSWRYRL